MNLANYKKFLNKSEGAIMRLFSFRGAVNEWLS
jgi:hypothetical protein